MKTLPITQHLEITNFGPIKTAEIEVKKCNILIGPQASGKSTVAKLIHFFRDIPAGMYRLASSHNKPIQLSLASVEGNHLSRLLDLFGSETCENAFSIKFTYFEDMGITISRTKSGTKQVSYSSSMRDLVSKFVQLVNNYIKSVSEIKPGDDPGLSLSRNPLISRIFSTVTTPFYEAGMPVNQGFIPSGRSILTALTQIGNLFDSPGADPLLKEFSEHTSWLRHFVGRSRGLKSIKAGYARPNTKRRTVLLDHAEEKINEILKGRYRLDGDKERLFYDASHFVALSNASSGQQESLWILLATYVYLAFNMLMSLTVEEPEAHLYPEAQKSIVELLALFVGNRSNQLTVTTHSPYIMSALNNLLLAHAIGEKRGKSRLVQEIVPKPFWVDPSTLSALCVRDGKVIDVLDHEQGVLKTSFVDSVSDPINACTNQLLDLESQ